MTDQPLDDFEQAVAPYLAAGMPAKHGLSVDAYVAKCWELWGACQTDETCKNKLLIDRLHVETLGLPEPKRGDGYVDPRARATTDLERPSSSELLQCIAIGIIPFSSVLKGNRAKPEATDDPFDPTKETEYGLFIVAVLDVLGFERMYRRIGPTGMKAAYKRLIAVARSCTDDRLELAMHSFSDTSVPTLFSADVSFSYFSDTLLLWAPLNQERVSPFLARCADVFLEALSLGIPLRGAIAVGEAVLNQRDGIFLGTPIIDAARLEQAQDWIGVALTGQCKSVLSWIDSSLVAPYSAPCKAGTRGDLISGLVLDWPRRARSHRMDALTVLDGIQRSGSHSKYYDHARDFIAHSARTASWNREHHIPICPEFLTRAIIRTRLDAAEPQPEVTAMLESMALNGTDAATTAACLRALLEGGEMPVGVETLPQGTREHVQFVQGVLAGGLIAVEEVAMAAIEQRAGIAPLTERHMRYLATPLTERNAEWQRCLPIIREIAGSGEVPDIPEGLSSQVEKVLKSAREAALGHTAPVDMEALLSGVLWARTTGRPVSRQNLRRLDALERGGIAWGAVAVFLRAIAEGAYPKVDLQRFDEGAISTIRAVRKALGWQDAVRCSVEDALRSLPRIDIEFLYQLTADVVEALRGRGVADLDPKIASLECAGSPHDAVARALRGLLRDRHVMPLPEGIPTDARWYLGLIMALGLHDASSLEGLEGRAGVVGEPLLDYAFSVALDVRTAQRGLRLYEQEILILLGSMSEELSALVNFLGSFVGADREPEIPPAIRVELRGAIVAWQERARAIKTTVTLEDDAGRALACRGGPPECEFIDALRRRGAGIGDDAKAAAFLLALAEGSVIPAIDEDLEDEARNILLEVGVRALCRDLALSDLVAAAVDTRLYGEPLREDAQGAFSALAGSAEPFRGIGEFLARLCEENLWPSLPADAPRRALTLLASARQHVSEGARHVIAVERLPEVRNPTKPN